MKFDPSFLDDIRDSMPIEHLAGRYTKLTKAGSELRGLSPINAERSPSFYVSPRKRKFFDFSANENGDVFKLVMLMEGCSFPDAVARCAAEAGIRMPDGYKASGSAVEADRERERRREAFEAKKAVSAAAEARRQRSTREQAHDIWKAGVSIAGTLAEVYLRSRGIDFAASFGSLRFHGSLVYTHPETLQITRWPALLAAVRAPDDGRFLAVWRIYLQPNGAGKAPVPNAKLGLGSYTSEGGSVWLGMPGPVANVTEGIETALGVVGILHQAQGVQAALSTSGLLNFKPPPRCERTVIWPDGDADRMKTDVRTGEDRFTESPGLRAATRKAAELNEAGHPTTLQPIGRRGYDFLDIYNSGKGKRDGY